MASELKVLLGEFPIVTVLGPRQAGKTTLLKNTLPDYDYVNLEHPETRRIALEDPIALLKKHAGKTIFDEIQRVPELLSYLQGIVDEKDISGHYVLTGSHQLQLHEAVSQSLAGRTGLLHLLPLSIVELSAAGLARNSFEEYAFYGFLPRVHAKGQRPTTAYASYFQTYVERDVRQMMELKNITLFEKFIKLLAGRIGQVMNYQSLGNDVGVSATTLKQWLSLLEASYVIYKLPPYFENTGKRVIKSPKYYFTDTGLLCYLLGITHPEQISRDPLMGSIFENLIVMEAVKCLYNQGKQASLYFYRDSNGVEIDLLYTEGRKITGIEIKAASTYHSDFKNALLHFHKKISPLHKSYIIYQGEAMEFSDGIEAVPYERTGKLFSA